MKTKLLFAGVMAAMLFACSSEDNATGKDFTTKNEENTLAQLQAQALQNLRQKFVFNADGQEQVTLVSKKGVRINIVPSRLKLHGGPVHGPVIVEYIEIFDRGDMVTANKSTMGVYQGGVGQGDGLFAAATAASDAQADQVLRPLRSGGEFFVNMKTEQGENLDEGSEFNLQVPAQLTGEPQDDMQVWKGEETADGDVKWTKDVDAAGNEKDAPLDGGGNYLMDMDSFGWCNIDQFWDFPGETTLLWVDPPSNYDDSNSKVYAAFFYNQNSIARLDTYDWGLGMFKEHYGWVPVGLQCHIIFVSGSGSNWVYATKTVTVTSNHPPIVIDPSEIVTATQADLINVLSGLQ